MLDFLSSAERKGTSPNRVDVKACTRCRRGVVGLVIAGMQTGAGVTKGS